MRNWGFLRVERELASRAGDRQVSSPQSRGGLFLTTMDINRRLDDLALEDKAAVEFPSAAVDHSSTKLLDCWEKVSDCMNKSSDQMSLFNAIPLLSQHIKAKKTELLLQQVLPILINKQKIDPPAIVKCREINESIKRTVDDTLEETQPWWLSLWYEFETAQRIQAFMNYARNLPEDRTPFLAHSCSIHATNRDCIRTATAMFNSHGAHLSHVRVNFDFLATPRYMNVRIIRILQKIPNVETLEILGRLQLNNDQMERQRHLIRGTLPTLPKLNRFSLRLYHGLPHIAPIFTQMLAAYGPQLPSFACHNFAFLAGIHADTFTHLLRSLQHLQISHLDLTCAPVFRQLSLIQLPLLKILELRRAYDEDAQDIIFSIETLSALHNFRWSLEQLIMDSVTVLFPRIYPPMLEVVFPRLKTLSVCTTNANFSLNMWRYFEANFPYMEEIHFATGIDRYRDPIPANDILRQFFENFPHLNKITWEHLETPLEPKRVCSRYDAMGEHT